MPLWSWLIAGVGYIALVAVARAFVPDIKRALAFSKPALAMPVPDDAVVDVASEAEKRVVPTAPVPAV